MQISIVAAAVAAAVLAGPGCGSRASTGSLDPTRFAPRPEWTPEAYARRPDHAHRTPEAPITRDEQIEDIAYLQHALTQAWAHDAAATPEVVPRVLGSLREVVWQERETRDFCRALAEQASHRFEIALGGQPCRPQVALAPVVPLDPVPPGKHFAWRLERDGQSEIGRLTIDRFAPPDDPGWDGFSDVLAALAEVDVVVIDLQRARGDDFRMGLAVLAALGTTGPGAPVLPHWFPAVRDNPYAEVMRRNHAARAGAAWRPRDRAMWLPLRSTGDALALARTLSPRQRATDRPPPGLSFIAGAGCESACQLVVWLANDPFRVLASTAQVPDRLSGDEPGTIRLPHSGIDVTFPTVSYGPLLGGAIPAVLGSDLATTVLAPAHELARRRAEIVHWRTAARPTCTHVDPLPGVLETKAPRCIHRPGLPDPSTFYVELALDEPLGRAFLETCPGARVQSVRLDERAGKSDAILELPRDELARLASAPFVRKVYEHCEPPVPTGAHARPAGAP